MATPTTAIINVTPDQAAEWLANNNTRNRTIRDSKVAAYARDMSAGAWQFNGDPIRFATDGALLDGQHRLSAVIRAGITVPMLVIWGLPSETQDTMDIGAHRLLRDQLMLRGEQDPKDLAAIARRAVVLERSINGGVPGGHMVPTHAEMMAYINANPSIKRAAEVAVRAGSRRVPAAPSVIGTAYHMCSKVDTSDAEIFFVTQVIEMVGLYEGDPARALLNRLQRDYVAAGRQMSPDDVYRYSIVAWNHYRAGTKISKLQAPKGGWGSDNMPQPR